jgi:RNA polymerase sigma-70 factor (ECF subfamily)
MTYRDVQAADDRFAQWYAAEAAPLKATLCVVTGNPDIAEEATAEAFARAYARWTTVEVMASPGGWVYTVALNLVRRWARRHALERMTVAKFRAVDVPVEVIPELNDELWRAVGDLPPRARTAIGLRYVADLPEGEIADIMGISRGAVAATLSKARVKLAAALAETRDERGAADV